ncbi:MAG: 6-carboxytetrahydropterin synthase [Egibacteraceae bacterium]
MIDADTFSVTVSSGQLGFRALHFCAHPDGMSEPLHGHRYTLTVTVHRPIREDGYVLDFRTLEDIVNDVRRSIARSCYPRTIRHSTSTSRTRL